MAGVKQTKKKRQILSGSKSIAGRKVDQVLAVLASVGVPVAKLSITDRDRVALALLAISNLRPSDSFENAGIGIDGAKWRLTSREIIIFQNEFWFQNISLGSYDDIRRKDLKLLVLAGIAVPSADNPNASQNNPSRRYALSNEAVELIRSVGNSTIDQQITKFIANRDLWNRDSKDIVRRN